MSNQSETKEKKKKGKTTWRKDVIEIAFFIVIAVIIVVSFNNVLGLALNTDTPLVVVTSESMEPSYWGSNRDDFGGQNDIRKDMLIVRGVDPSEIIVGDTIVFKYINHTEGVDIPIVHRVNRIYVNESTGDYWFTTKGDNPDSNAIFIEWPDIDELNIHESRVVGKIVGRIPYLGGIYSYFRESQGRTVLLIVVGVLFLGTIILSFTSSDEEEDKKESEVFSEDTNHVDETKKDPIESKESNSFWKKIKKFFNRLGKHKHFIIPAFVLFIVILVPVIDTLSANWNSHFGVVDIEYDRTRQYDVQGGNDYFVYCFITINNPGHWHQKFDGMTIQVLNTTTSEVLGESYWFVVHNFEGQKRLSLGAWVENGLMINGSDYQLSVIAHLSNKFGASWTDVLVEPFTFISIL